MHLNFLEVGTSRRDRTIFVIDKVAIMLLVHEDLLELGFDLELIVGCQDLDLFELVVLELDSVELHLRQDAGVPSQ